MQQKPGTTSLFDPSQLDDSIASQTSWRPVESGGASFQTHHLHIVSKLRIKFQVSFQLLLLAGAFFVMGLVVMALGGLFWLFVGLDQFWDKWDPIILLIGGVFAVIGAYQYYVNTHPIVFDKEANVFWKGRKKTQKNIKGRRVKHLIPLEEIHAVQIIAKLISEEDAEYSYELNLVLKDTSRTNVIDHGNLNSIRYAADSITRFLQIPLWDSTS